MPRDGKGEALAFRAWQPRSGTNTDFTPNVDRLQSETGPAVGYCRGRAEIPSPGALRWAWGTAHPRLPSSRPLARPRGSTTSLPGPKCPKREQKSFLHPKADVFTENPREKLSDSCTSPLGVTSPY